MLAILVKVFVPIFAGLEELKRERPQALHYIPQMEIVRITAAFLAEEVAFGEKLEQL
jgi:hypothetical protein